MNIKLGNLNNILEGMNIFLQKELPIKISYKLSRLNKILIEEYQQFEEEFIFSECCDKPCPEYLLTKIN